MSNKKLIKRIARHQRLRKKIKGTSLMPRLAVHRSLKNIFCSIIDDTEGKTLLTVSTLDKEFKKQYGGNIKSATALGSLLAQRLKAKGINKVCFDCGGYIYHGRIKALADATRKEGLEF